MTFIGRLTIRTKVVLLAGIPVLGIVILAGVIAHRAQTQTAAAAALGSIEDVALLSVHISSVIHALQLERAQAALSEGFGAAPATTTQRAVVRQGELTAAAQAQLELFLAGHDLSRLPARLTRDLGIARVQAARRREFQDRMLRQDVSIDDILSFYGVADDALLSATSALTELSDDGELLRSISSLVALSQLTERASREHALLSYVFAAKEFPPGTFKMLVTLATEQDVYAGAFRANARGDQGRQFDDAQRSEAILRARTMRENTIHTTSDEFDIDARIWFDAAAGGLAKLQTIEQALLGEITRVATRKLDSTRASVRLGLWLSVAVVVASGLLAWFIAHAVTRSIVDLSSAAAQVRQTNDFAVRAKKTSADELGTLADMFNDMLAMIEARDTHLEAQVAERTDELRRTVAELWSEMDLARKIQTLLLPQNPQLPGYDVAAMMVPASSVGGDYYDVFRMDGVDWILVGDVSGHGVTAGLTMMIIQTAVRTVIQTSGDRARQLTPKQLLNSVNSAVRSNLQKIDAEQYMTIMALRLERGKVTYSGLHQDILVYRAQSKTVERIETRGIWLGLVDDISDLLEDDEFEMAEGDTLLLYTDGVTEIATGDQMLGTDGLATMLQGLAGGSTIPAEVMKGVIDRACEDTLSDDVTVLVARYDPSKIRQCDEMNASTAIENPALM